MSHIKFVLKTECLVASVNNHYSAYYSEIKLAAKLLLYLIFSNVKKKQECFRKIFSGHH